MGEIGLQANSRLLKAIGPRLYPDASTGIIELVSNSYDADATAVRIEVRPAEIVVADNGTGMDEPLLVNFFTLGKSIKPPSRYGRQPIGQFGIGKFAILAMANKFQVYGAHGPEDAREYVVASFDEASYGAETLLNDIRIPLTTIDEEEWREQVASAGVSTDPEAKHSISEFGTGVIVVLQDLRSSFSEELIRAKVVERLSHTFKNQFDVYVNSELAEERYIHGARYAIDVETPFGQITGEVVSAPDTFKLNELVGVRVQVHGRMVKRELFGADAYDHETAQQLTGYIDAEFLNDSITPDRAGFAETPELAAARDAMFPLLREVIDAENSARASDIVQRQSKMLNRAVRQVTAVLRQFPNLAFPETALSDSIPVELAQQEHKAEVVAELQPEASLEATVTASRANLDRIIKAIQQAAEELRLSNGVLEEDDIRSYSDIVDAITKMLGQDSAPLVEDINAVLTGRIFEEQDLEAAQRLITEKIIQSVTDFVRQQLEKKAREGLLGEDREGAVAGGAILAGGGDLGLGNDRLGRSSANQLRIRPPVVGRVVPIEKPVLPAPPLGSDTSLPTKLDPKEEGNDEGAAIADIQNYIACTIEHLGPDGPATMLAEGFGYHGTMIYINADHRVYNEMEQVRMGFLSFYVASLIVDEVLGLQDTMSHREKINIKAELLKQMMLRDRKMLFRK